MWKFSFLSLAIGFPIGLPTIEFILATTNIGESYERKTEENKVSPWTFFPVETYKRYILKPSLMHHICFYLYMLLRFYGFPYLPFSPLVLAYA